MNNGQRKHHDNKIHFRFLHRVEIPIKLNVHNQPTFESCVHELNAVINSGTC